MSIIGNKIAPNSTGILSPYIRITMSTSSDDQYIWKAYLYGYEEVPNALCQRWCDISNGGIDFTNSPHVTKVGDYAFYLCRCPLTNVPNTIREVGIGSFTQTKITALPNDLETIEETAFQNCSSLTTLSPNIQKIGSQAFYGCTGLTITELPASVRQLGEGTGAIGKGGCFEDCTGIPSIIIHDGVTILPYGCFMDCSNLTVADLPSTLSTIQYNAFHRCSKLTTIYCRANTPPTMAYSIGFGTVSALAHIYVPEASVSAYQTATNWSQYASKISAIPD